MKRFWKWLTTPWCSWLDLVIILTVTSWINSLGSGVQFWYIVIIWSVIGISVILRFALSRRRKHVAP